ncbi:MAG: helix-turn-helix transcriptional regulator [Bacteroidota bacterium]
MPNKALVAASTKPLVLSILAYGKNYGYRIIQEVERLSEGELEWTDAMLYPVLKRMEKEQLITSHWVKTPNGRKRKYYEITPTGREQLAEDRRQWQRVTQTFTRLWDQTTNPLSLTD